MKYNKLVRDKIPEIIESKGEPYTSHIADEKEYYEKLIEKIQEEADEIVTDGNPKEDIGDILEVLEAIAAFHGYDWQEILSLQKEKAEKRGGFTKRIILDES